MLRSRIPFHTEAIRSDAENIRTLNSGWVSVVNNLLVWNGLLDPILELELALVSIEVAQIVGGVVAAPALSGKASAVAALANGCIPAGGEGMVFVEVAP